nr:unnamed protein product [Digitaria exilis]
MLFQLDTVWLSLRSSGGEIGGNDDDRGAADRAVDVGTEPRVDARRVERVRAAREEADQLPVGELAEANRAVPAPAHPAAVFHGGYGRDGGLVEPHRADVPHVVHHPSPAPALLLVAEPAVVGPFSGGCGEAAPAAQDEAAAAVEEERGEREREKEEGGEQGDDEEEAHGRRVAVGGRGARDHRDRGRRGQRSPPPPGQSRKQSSGVSVQLKVTVVVVAAAYGRSGVYMATSSNRAAAAQLGRRRASGRRPRQCEGAVVDWCGVETWSGLVVVGFGLANAEQFGGGAGAHGLPTATATARARPTP